MQTNSELRLTKFNHITSWNTIRHNPLILRNTTFLFSSTNLKHWSEGSSMKSVEETRVNTLHYNFCYLLLSSLMARDKRVNN